MPFDPFRSAADPDADDLPANAADCYDAMVDAERHISAIAHDADTLLAQLDIKRDGVTEDAEGYTYHHAREWERIAAAASEVAAAFHALAERLRRA
jgi:hypothetical protein